MCERVAIRVSFRFITDVFTGETLFLPPGATRTQPSEVSLTHCLI
jgi:hypothetical protein